ncbi:MAG: EAL domain-containing protein [Pseudomonadota bacterium]
MNTAKKSRLNIFSCDNIQLLVSVGFLAVLALMFALLAISLFQLQSGNESMAKLVHVTNSKTAAANTMRDAIRQRANSLKAMRLSNDFFERDDEHQRFIGYAGKYRLARKTLVDLGTDNTERAIHHQLGELTRDSQPWNENAADLLMGDAPDTEIAATMALAETRQNRIMHVLDRLVQLEQENATQALATSREHYVGTRQLLITLAALAFIICLMIMRMVTLRVARKNQQLSYQASHDPLTGLINRREFEERADRAITHAQAQSATHALLYMDLDQFKIVNDTCGHAAGDELLQQLSQLLLSSVRNRDTLSRLGGDEFGMLLENCPLDKAVEIANNLLHAVEGFHFTWHDETFTLGISVGIVPLDRSTTDLARAMSAADSACYIAKETGRNRVQIASMGDKRLQERHGQMQWVSRINRALEEDRFTLYFQPIVPCASTKRNGKHIEILLRLIDDDGAIVAPGSFLPAAKKYNLAASIDRWVIHNAMSWLALESTHNHCPLMISINLSGQSMGNPEMLKFIIDKMEATGIAPEQVCFEITETAAIANITVATSFMLTLRGCGFRFSLDDFGSGLSSFTYLKKLPVDFLKIDGTFVRDITSDPVDHAMVRSINELGQLLGKETIAEFVETAEVAAELRNMGVDYAQGYAFSQPQSLDDYTQVMGPRLVVVGK